MTQSEAKAVLLLAFNGGLTAEQRARLRMHAEKRTPIACGLHFYYYAYQGAG